MAEPFLGMITMVGFNFAPLGWAFCDGQSLPISQNEALYTLIGTTYGGDGVSTFILPNLQSRVAVGFGDGPQTSNYTLGQSGGVEAVTITSTTMASHTHQVQCIQENADQLTPVNYIWATEPSASIAFYSDSADSSMSPLAITTAGGGQPHDNIQPVLCVNFCISLVGIWPSQQ